ncbi:MAG: hypothetical protein GY795_11415 [Desulfobacterales bacterium]|nr:hypothetical protein [Desulfobacterales bacterium]
MSDAAILIAKNRRLEGDAMSDGDTVAKSSTVAAEFGKQSNDLLVPIFDAEHQGVLTAVAGTNPIRLPFAVDVINVTLAVDTAPTDADILVDVNEDGTTIYTTQASRPTIAATETSGEQVAAPDEPRIAADAVISVDVDQVGSTVAGADLAVVLQLRPVIDEASAQG